MLRLALLLIGSMLTAQPTNCEDRLAADWNRFATDANAYMRKYHIETVSANPRADSDRQRRQDKIREEIAAVMRCECW